MEKPMMAEGVVYMSNRTPAYLASVAVMELLEDAGDFEGTATELLNLLEFSAPEAAQKMRSWPKSPRALSNRLRRSATFLRQTGIDVDVDGREGGTGRRIIELRKRSELGCDATKTL